MAASRIRWDRLGRIALLGVLGLVLYLYVGPTRTFLATVKESKRRDGQLAELRHTNAQLRRERDALKDPASLELQARMLGMVRGGEKTFVVRGLPAN